MRSAIAHTLIVKWQLSPRPVNCCRISRCPMDKWRRSLLPRGVLDRASAVIFCAAVHAAKEGDDRVGLRVRIRRVRPQFLVCWRTVSINMNWRLPEKPICCRRFRSASNRRSRFPASVPQSDPAGLPIPAWTHGRPTSPQAHSYSSDTPNQQRYARRSRSDWRSQRLHLYHRPLFTDFLHFGAAIAASCSQASPAKHDAIGGCLLATLP